MQRLVRSLGAIKGIAWHEKAKCDVLIFDAVGSEYLKECIPLSASINILRVREGIPLIKSFRFFLLLLGNVFRRKRLGLALIESLLNCWKPKLVITFIDNSPAIGRIKSLFPNIPCVSVQNGTRWDLSRKGQPKLEFDVYFSFGEVEREIFNMAGHSARSIYPIGSLKAGLFLAKIKRENIETLDICYVSQFRYGKKLEETSWESKVVGAYLKVGKEVFFAAAKFAKQNNLKLSVAMRYSASDPGFKEELAYYASVEHGAVDFIPNMEYSSYEAISKAKLTISLSSTLGLESLGMGNRVLFAKDVRELSAVVLDGGWRENLATYRLPDFQRLYSTTYEEISKKAEDILAMSGDEYLERSKDARCFYMNLRANNLPQKIVEKTIREFLGEA